MNSEQWKAKIVLSNEDDSFKTFLKLLVKANALSSCKVDAMRCIKTPPRATLSNKYKKVQLQYFPHEGQYEFQYNETTFKLVLQRGQVIIVTQCRQLDYEKSLTVYGPTIEKVQQFVHYVFHTLDEQDDDSKITVYENNGGYWRISKEKKPRKLESVIFKQEFINSVLEDINEFIQSQQWYIEMGIPYKRSYLLYGPPGTGKSSFAQAIAAQIKFSICFVNCSDKINDFNFNSLLNQAPKKSVILIEDVDAIFSERKNTEKNNQLTFSGFLNAIDGVRSQQGRIIIMTTNYKQRLDPALLRPGRVDQSYEINYASHFQIEKLCLRFYKKEKLAKQFASKLPQHKFSMSQIQGFLLKYRKNPEKILEKVQDLLDSDENVKIGQFLTQINCQQCTNDFKIEQCYTLAHAKNLPKQTVEKIVSKLSPLLKGRLIQVIRMDRTHYIKSHDHIVQFIQQTVQDEQIQRKLKNYLKENHVKTLYVIRDLAKQFSEEKIAEQKNLETKVQQK